MAPCIVLGRITFCYEQKHGTAHVRLCGLCVPHMCLYIIPVCFCIYNCTQCGHSYLCKAACLLMYFVCSSALCLMHSLTNWHAVLMHSWLHQRLREQLVQVGEQHHQLLLTQNTYFLNQMLIRKNSLKTYTHTVHIYKYYKTNIT